MEPFTTLTSIAMPVPIRNVDTDMIIPAQYLTSTSRDGYGENLFKRLREEDPNFPLGKEEYQNAKVIITDDNFGCGSSREHAVWALMDAGFKAIIAPSFADIFSSNSGKNGLLLITLPQNSIHKLLATAKESQVELTISLEDQTVSTPDGNTHSFDYDPFRKRCLLEGLEDLDFLIKAEEKIRDFRNKQEEKRFYRTTEVNNG